MNTAIIQGEGTPAPAAPRQGSKRWLLWILVALAVVGGGIGLWDQVLKDDFIARRWGVVEPGEVYRSGQLSESMLRKKLRENRIAVVVDLNGSDDKDAKQQAEARAIAELGVEAHRFPLAGNGTGDIRSYANAIEEIVKARKAGKPILVHCSAGTQRTGGVIAVYRILVQGTSPREAHAELARYDWNPHRDAVLLIYLNRHMEELAGLLVQAGVIDRVPSPVPVIAP